MTPRHRKVAQDRIPIRTGFSLVELLVCIAIISILMAMYAGVAVRAMSKAKRVVVAEGMRQEHIGRMADSANIARGGRTSLPDTTALRELCRQAYRQEMDVGGRVLIFTELLFVVQNEAEFRAYWHTLIDPNAADPIELAANGDLVARDDAGNAFSLEWRGREGLVEGGVYPVIWEFLSTDTKYMSAESLGTTVLYSDGHIEYHPYPSRYPACRSVAELSQRFMDLQ